MTKTISILTLPLTSGNYGGVLQAYALSQVLADYGYDVYHQQSVAQPTFSRRSLFMVKQIAKCVLGRVNDVEALTLGQVAFRRRHIDRFVSDHIRVEGARSSNALNPPKLYVVGSDQVWRKEYAPKLLENFGSTIAHEGIQIISYAASFGIANVNDYSANEKLAASKLLRKFAGVSTREEEGVRILDREFGVDAHRHVDPTLLLDRAMYEKLAEKLGEDTAVPSRFVFQYVLDSSSESQRIGELIGRRIGASLFSPIPPRQSLFNKLFSYKLKPSVETWIAGIARSEFVLTDSFHGCVFAILFNKKFGVVVNRSRGASRFETLLQLFGLEDRIISEVSEDALSHLVDVDIDWESVNQKVEIERDRAKNYLGLFLS